MRFPTLVLACLVGTAAWMTLPSGALQPRSAHAAVSIAYTLDELVDDSPRVVIAKALERTSRWEQLGGNRRIVTYTKLQVTQTVYGKAAKTLWVRTLGGAVGRIGQQVAGEASLRLDESALLFLSRTEDGVTVVSGAAQGHFPLRRPVDPDTGEKAGKLMVQLSPSMGTILRRRGPSVSAQETLIGKSLDEAIATIRDTKTRRDALRKQKQSQ